MTYLISALYIGFEGVVSATKDSSALVNAVRGVSLSLVSAFGFYYVFCWFPLRREVYEEQTCIAVAMFLMALGCLILVACYAVE